MNKPTDEEIEKDSQTDHLYSVIMELSKGITPIEAFEFEGVMFLGYWPEAVKEYAKQNPSKKFYVWLCDNYKRLNAILP